MVRMTAERPSTDMGAGGKMSAMKLCKPFVDELMVATLTDGTWS